MEKMVKKLKNNDPYRSLISNLYSIGIFKSAINGLLSIIEKNDKYRTILLERQFINNSNIYIESGYYFIQCFNCTCNKNELKQFRNTLENIVKQKTKGNYMEVDPIIIAVEFSPDVLNFIYQYNRIQRRKPIQLFSYGE
ncbi:hypothetical protein KKB17_05545 [bacterium]|nr:hypothetical protein [bacterium]